MDLDTLWEFMSGTSIMGVTIAELVGKLVLLVVVSLVAYLVGQVLCRLARKVLDKAAIPSASILVNMLRALIWFLALITVLEPVFGVKPTAFVAALGVGSVALSLGLQDTISNIIGGLTLMAAKQIEPGDAIRVGDFTGVVTDITWRSTSMRDAYGQVNIIPNSVLSKVAMVKLSDFTRSRCQISVVIKHGTDLNDVRGDVARVARDVLGKRVDQEMGVDILVSGFDAFGIQGTVEVHLVRGVNFDDARTMLAQHLIGRPWVAHIS